jgi:hypothetical protein
MTVAFLVNQYVQHWSLYQIDNSCGLVHGIPLKGATPIDVSKHRVQRTVRDRTTLTFSTILCLAATLAITQHRHGLPDEAAAGVRSRSSGDFRWRRGRSRRLPSRSEFPTWEIEREFEHEVFTFVRIQYDSFGPFGWWDRWDNDYPDGDWNFSYRLQQLTSLKVAPNSKVIRLSDPELFNYPFVYMAGVQRITLSANKRNLHCDGICSTAVSS